MLPTHLAGVLLAGVLLVAACGSEVPSATPTDTPAATDASPSPTADRSPTPAATLPIDPALLDHLPSAVDDLALERADEGLAEAVADPDLAANAEAAAAALAVDPETGDLVYAALVLLRPGVMSDAFYRDWRDTFNEGVCAQAGGVAGNAEAEIGDRQTFIGTCQGGLRTYHVWLRNSRVLASVWSVGERRLGERLVEGLTD